MHELLYAMDELAKFIPGIQISSRRALSPGVFRKSRRQFLGFGKGWRERKLFLCGRICGAISGWARKIFFPSSFSANSNCFPSYEGFEFSIQFRDMFHVFREWMVSVLYFLFLRLRILPISPFPPFFSTLFCRILSLLLSLPPLCGVKKC